jgi:hypothetical protein
MMDPFPTFQSPSSPLGPLYHYSVPNLYPAEFLAKAHRKWIPTSNFQPLLCPKLVPFQELRTERGLAGRFLHFAPFISCFITSGATSPPQHCRKLVAPFAPSTPSQTCASLKSSGEDTGRCMAPPLCPRYHVSPL